MKKIFLAFILCIVNVSFSSGQGTIRGKVTDENGETLIGVTIILKLNKSVGTSTDLDGNYSFKISDTTAQTLIISYISFKTIEEPVHMKNGEVVIKNFVLELAAKEIKEVVVTAKAVKAKEYYMEKIKMNSSSTIDYVSGESMKKTGDANVVSAVARVSGVATHGGIITVRGIGDRYVKTAINGSRIPTLDPFTNNIKLDLFPASLVDNILLTKTASPDLPGDWAGAYLSVETKDYPEQLSVQFETTAGYNSQSSFKDGLTSTRSPTDWLGFDNNFRDRNHVDFTSATIAPSPYQEFVALGLGPYFNSMGITSQNWGEGTSRGETYFKLGLVQLGLLSPALIQDEDAYAKAQNLYLNGSYKPQAFNTINADVPASGKSFPDNWNTVTRKTPLNFSQSFSIGNQTKLVGKPIGFLVGYRYGSSILYDPESNYSRIRYDGTLESSAQQKSSVETNGWSALLNTACKINPNNSVSILFMPNFTGVNNVRKSYDYSDSHTAKVTNSQFYEQRKQLVYQFKSEHFIQGPKLKVELNASYTNGRSSAPDFKNIFFKRDSATLTNYQIGPTVDQGIHRYFRYLSDDLFDSRISIEMPLGNSTHAGVRKLKFGGAYQSNSKKNDQYDYTLNFGSHPPVMVSDDLNQFFSPDNFEISSGNNNGIPYSTINMYYSEANSPANHTFGTSKITAGFVMLDYFIFSSLRFSGGLRVEHANILTDVSKFDSLGLLPNDVRRDYRGGFPAANPGKLDEVSYLPSAGLIYKLKADESAPFNVRVNYSQTVARPSIRELSDVAVFDYEFKSFVFGNSDLKMVRINNYDMRVESYFSSGENVSVSLFYKDFKNHIELVNSGGYTWHNVDKSHVTGFELEGKKKLTKHVDFGANLTVAASLTEFVRTRLEIEGSGVKNYIPVDTISRSMFGQAPYVINGILTYTADSLGLIFTLSYNVQGPRLVVASDIKEIPDVYEQPRNLIDIKLMKSVGKQFSISFTIRDILNIPIRRAYKGTNVDYDNYDYGTNYLLGISYKL